LASEPSKRSLPKIRTVWYWKG